MLSIENLSIEFHAYKEVVHAVNNIDLQLEEGETLGLVGETGAGKTTTALGIMGLLEKRTTEFITLLVRDAGFTLEEADLEVTNALDYCRFYERSVVQDGLMDGTQPRAPSAGSHGGHCCRLGHG